MIFQSFASSSHGNAYLVSDGQTHILLECGLAFRTLQKKLDFKLSEVNACLLSHEHKDHSKCVQELIKSGIPVYMSDGTAQALELQGMEIIEARQQLRIGTMDIVPFETFHDANEPLGFYIRSTVDGEALAFATDTVNLGFQFEDLSMLAIESNYDSDILARSERMPEKTKRRITNSHMEISRLCEYLKTLDLRKCREIFLLHLSDATGHEGNFVYKVMRVVPPHVRVTACGK